MWLPWDSFQKDTCGACYMSSKTSWISSQKNNFVQISHQVGVEGMTHHLPEAPFRNVIYLSPHIFYLFR